MKFFVVLALIALICAVKASRQDLLTRAQDLENRINIQIEKLMDSKPVEASELEADKNALKLLAAAVEVGMTMPHSKEDLNLIESRLNLVENAIEAKLSDLEGRNEAAEHSPRTTSGEKAPSLFKAGIDTKREELENRAHNLEVRMEAQVEKLRISHSLEALLLDKEERALKQLVIELAMANFPPVLTALEVRLSMIEKAFEARLSKLEATPNPNTPGSRLTARD